MQPPNTRRVLVPVTEAAARLGISPSEVRRRVTAGTIEAEKFDRPQGSYLRIVFYEPEDTPSRAVPESEPTHHDAPPDALLPTLEALIATHEQLAEAYQRIAALEREAGTSQADASHERARANDLAERLTVTDRQLADQAETIRVQAETIAAAEDRADQIAAQLARRRWYDPRTWGG